MTTLTLAARDSSTMLRRQLRHIARYPSMTLMLAGMPVVFLLLFVFVLGGTLGAGLGGDRALYAGYVTPGVLLMAVAAATNGTAVSVAMDMTEGIIARFRTMAIFRPSVLTGHVVGSLVQTLATVALVTVIALLVGFRPTAGPVEWLAAAGIITLFAVALIWIAVGMGLTARTVESASNMPMPLTLLPFLGSGFVPTDSMPTWLRWFAEYQPFTPVIETVRGLLLGGPVAGYAVLAIGWSVLLGAVGYVWSVRRYR